MTKKILILTKSRKFSGYCVAGIDLDTNKWVRLEHPQKKSLEACDLDYSYKDYCKILDVVEVEILTDKLAGIPFQPENIYINPKARFKRLYTTDWNYVKSLNLSLHQTDLILGMDSGFENESDTLNARLRKTHSLQYLEVTDLKIYSDAGVKADFTYKGKQYRKYCVTDSDYNCWRGTANYSHATLIVSRGLPHQSRISTNPRYHCCFVAKIALPDELNKTA